MYNGVARASILMEHVSLKINRLWKSVLPQTGSTHYTVLRLSQIQLTELIGIPQSTTSGIENDRIQIGVERAKVLARALRCHPAVLVFP